MQQPLQRTLFFAIAFLAAGILNAQAPTPFWAEDFTNGFPTGWVTTDASNQGALWTWCPNQLLGNSNPGCAPVFDDALNGQLPFNSASSSTGYMVMDSDQSGNLSANHKSRLTTAPINCSGKGEVFITFQTHIGVYTVPAETGAVLRVSTDGTNWTEYTVFPGLTTTVRWSDNPAIPIIDISATAANQSNVLIQWQWTGNWEYMWELDDIEIYDQNPAPRSDIAISAFFYPVSSYETPASQIATDTFNFEVNLSNNGLNPQTNIVVTAYVKEDGGSTLLTQTISIPALAPGVSDSGFVFPLRFAPELLPGVYVVGYSVTSDSADQRPLDNERSSQFVVSNNVFAKENGPEQGYRPGAGGDWAVANYYRMSGGNFEKFKATQAEFAFTTNEDELPIADVAATIYLFKINHDVAEDFSDFDLSFISSSMEWQGVANYEAPDSIQGYELQQIEITDLNAGTPGVALETGGRYLLAIGYDSPSDVVFHAFNDNNYYYFPSTFVFNSDWNPNGFGANVNAVLRMTISLVSTTDEQALPENTLRIFPNPVHDRLQLETDFAVPTDATITISDISGKVVKYEDRTGLTNETLQYSLPNLAAGTYLARIATAKGTLTKKFIVQ